MIGLTLEATGCQASIGDYCDVIAGNGFRVESEVVGFSGDRLYLMPTGDAQGLGPSARVIPRQRAGTVRVGPQLLGRIIDGGAHPLDDFHGSPSRSRWTSASDRSTHCSP
jgi:flagellum-specific ATP synthase